MKADVRPEDFVNRPKLLEVKLENVDSNKYKEFVKEVTSEQSNNVLHNDIIEWLRLAKKLIPLYCLQEQLV